MQKKLETASITAGCSGTAGSTISACEKSSCWRTALALMVMLPQQRLQLETLSCFGLVMFVEWPLFQVDQRNPSHIPWIISRVSLLPIGPVMEIAVSQKDQISMKFHDINDKLGYFFKLGKGEDAFVDC